MHDTELFQAWRQSGSEQDFVALVASQVDLAYSVALRRVRDTHLAEDVTQAVFILLVKKAAMLPSSTNLAGWIFRTTQFVANNALRALRRQQKRERTMRPEDLESVATLTPTSHAEVAIHEQLEAIDGALLRLGKKDQEAVLMKYYRGKSWHEVGEAMGLSEDAARKRVKRALVRLREVMPTADAAHGTMSGAAAAPALLMGHAVQPAPAHVMVGVLHHAAAGAAATHTAGYALAKGAMTAMKMKWLSTVVAALLMAVPATIVVLHTVIKSPVVEAAASAAPLSFTLGERTTRITGPLRADGTVDYVAAINARYGHALTKQTNGFAQWLEIIGPSAIGVDQPLTLWAGNAGGMWQPSAETKANFLQMCGVDAAPKGETWVSFNAFAAANLWTARGRPPGSKEAEPTGRELWDEQAHPEYAAYLQEMDAPLNRAVAAAQMDRWWIPAVSRDGRTLTTVVWPAVTWPSTGPLDQMAATLCARASLSAQKGDFPGFKRDVLAVKQMARHVAGGAAMVQRMTGAGIDRRASETVGVAANGAAFSPAQWKELGQTLDTLPPLPDMVEAVDITERWLHLDNAAVVAIGKGAEFNESIGNGRAGKIEWKEVDWDAALVRINGVYDEAVAGMQKGTLREMQKALSPLGKRMLKAREDAIMDVDALKKDTGETRQAYTERTADAILGMWSTVAVLTTVETKHREAALEDRMARALVAAAQFHAEKGKWPDDLAQLTPGYLKEVPSDMYSADGAAVNYEAGHRGVIIYSVGPNGAEDAGLHNVSDGTDDMVVGQ